jgi:DNA-binding NarL/FixJ family response regulator
MVCVAVADPRPLVRAGLHGFLSETKEIELLQEECKPTTLQRYCDQLSPDVLILSVHFPDTGFRALLSTLQDRYPQMYILLVIDHDESQILYQKLLLSCSNVKGIISLYEPAEEWLSALRSIRSGNIWLNQVSMNQWLRQTRQPAPPDPTLSRREREVLQLAAEGYTNKEIALRLNIVARTVEFHMNNILQKLQVSSRVEAALWFQVQQET